MREFTFDEDDFFHEPEELISGKYDTPASEDKINLTQFLPALKEYENHIGQTSFLIFLIFYKSQVFAYWHYSAWFEDFTKSFEEARDIFKKKEQIIKNRQADQENAARQAAENRENYLKGLLEELGQDVKFISLSTQKAKQEYGLARYPELSELLPYRLKDEISNLNARIQARKMLQ